MILDELSRLRAYSLLHPRLALLADYLEQHDLTNASAGRIEIDGERLFINVDDAEMRPREAQIHEVHRRYIDVHFPLSGTEICGWSPLSSLSEPLVPYDEPAQTYFAVQPGQFYICFPDDAHAPIIGEGTLRKLVAKVLIAD